MELLEQIKDMFGELFGDYIKDFVKFIFGGLADRFYLFLRQKSKPQLKYLGAKPNDSWTLYFGNIVLGNVRTIAFEDSSQQYIYGDIESTLIVGEVFSSWFDKSPDYSRHFINEGKINNILISVGGPKWNKVTAHLIGLLGCPVRYEEGYKGSLVRTNTGEKRLKYSESDLGSTKRIHDLGIILIGKKEYFAKTSLDKINAACVIMGYSTYGVRLAAEFLKSFKRDDKKLKKLLQDGSSRFCILIHGSIQIGSEGEVIGHVFDKTEILVDRNFFKADLYSY